MAIATAATTTVEAIKDRVTPALDTFEDTVRKGRQFITRSQRAAEDATDAATSTIRQHPLSAVMVAAGAGALVGALIGFGLGWKTRGRT